MKVGILTYHTANNYGTCLQAFALQNVIQKAGHDCDIIDFRGEHLKNSPVKNKGIAARLVDVCVYVGSRSLKAMANSSFQEFRNDHYCLSQTVSKDNLTCLGDEYDLFVSGSDQVWNPYICGCLELYLQEFVTNKAKCGSYAASFGITEIEEKYKQRYASALNGFEFLGVREPEGTRIIHELTGREATIVLDPTMLMTSEEWKEVEAPVSNIKEPFIFVYQLGPSARLLHFVQELSKRKGIKVVFCPFPVGKPQKGVYCPFISPAKWLWLMRHAEYVVTNSFHGTAFSINFEKQFFVDISDNLSTLSSRINRMLSLTGQESRLIKSRKSEEIERQIDYALVREKLNAQRELSKRYLNNMLDGR